MKLQKIVFCCTKKTLVAKDFRYISRSLSTIQFLLFKSTIPPTKLDLSYALESMATTTSPNPTLETRLARTCLWNHAYSSLSYATTIHPISFTKTNIPHKSNNHTLLNHNNHKFHNLNNFNYHQINLQDLPNYLHNPFLTPIIK
jgi:hypothetical protein